MGKHEESQARDFTITDEPYVKDRVYKPEQAQLVKVDSKTYLDYLAFKTQFLP